ncbi:hypothetical protein [Clostridioides difficile]|uniref:hypothetical protein n=1 Tax=Clostridioides difficile TaxID=1496 RepID=UPI000D1E570F|nr:hypothetical protein [Clostridioides difficile]HBE9444609.1 hypothetical protein [Clostridioides difficile]
MRKIITVDNIKCYWNNISPKYFSSDECKYKIKKIKESGKYIDVKRGSSKVISNQRYYRIQVLIKVPFSTN